MRRRNLTAAFCAVAAALVMTACNNTSGNQTTIPAETVTESAAEETEAAVDLDKLLEDIQAAYGEEYTPSMDYSAEELENLFGLGPDLYEAAIAQGPMITINIDTFIAVKAKSGMGEEAERILKDYRQDLIDNSLQYPMNLPKLYSSEVIRYGDYVFFVMLGTPTPESLDEGQDEALVTAKEKNQVAIDIINEAFGA